MDEQLEQQAGRGEGEVLPEAEVSSPSEEAAEETANEAGIREKVNTEGSPDEAEVVLDGELSDSEAPDIPSTHGEGGPPDTAVDEVLQPEGLAQRDYYAEWQELAEAHPEVIGKELPEDIYQACMQSELPPLRVYESMMLQKQSEQIAALQNEIATLRQNAENTARAPVSAAGGGPDNEPEDLFLKGFNSY